MDKITIAEASKRLGVSRMFLREGLKQGRFSFGTAVQTSKATPTKKGNWVFYINKIAFERYLKGEV